MLQFSLEISPDNAVESYESTTVDALLANQGFETMVWFPPSEVGAVPYWNADELIDTLAVIQQQLAPQYSSGPTITSIVVDKPEADLTLEESAYLSNNLAVYYTRNDMAYVRFIYESVTPGPAPDPAYTDLLRLITVLTMARDEQWWLHTLAL